MNLIFFFIAFYLISNIVEFDYAYEILCIYVVINMIIFIDDLFLNLSFIHKDKNANFLNLYFIRFISIFISFFALYSFGVTNLISILTLHLIILYFHSMFINSKFNSINYRNEIFFTLLLGISYLSIYDIKFLAINTILIISVLIYHRKLFYRRIVAYLR